MYTYIKYALYCAHLPTTMPRRTMYNNLVLYVCMWCAMEYCLPGTNIRMVVAAVGFPYTNVVRTAAFGAHVNIARAN